MCNWDDLRREQVAGESAGDRARALPVHPTQPARRDATARKRRRHRAAVVCCCADPFQFMHDMPWIRAAWWVHVGSRMDGDAPCLDWLRRERHATGTWRMHRALHSTCDASLPAASHPDRVACCRHVGKPREQKQSLVHGKDAMPRGRAWPLPSTRPAVECAAVRTLGTCRIAAAPRGVRHGRSRCCLHFTALAQTKTSGATCGSQGAPALPPRSWLAWVISQACGFKAGS